MAIIAGFWFSKNSENVEKLKACCMYSIGLQKQCQQFLHCIIIVIGLLTTGLFQKGRMNILPSTCTYVLGIKQHIQRRECT